jgi:anthranilate phosphoribosyltransferase
VLANRTEPPLLAAFLVALQMRGETAAELLGAVDAVRARQIVVDKHGVDAVDIGGSGGDAGRTFNVSTTAALIVAAAGVRVFKHGSRAFSGTCGSIDVAEQLGLPLANDPSSANQLMARHGLAVLPSGNFLRYPPVIEQTRRALRIRTTFNLIGPWCNPARVRRQVVGVSDERYVNRFAQIAQALEHKRALIVHGRDGKLDEFSPSGPSTVAEVQAGLIRTYAVRPEDFGLRSRPLADISGGPPHANAAQTRAILRNEERGAPRTVVLLTAGAALYVAEAAPTFAAGVQLASVTLDSGRPYELVARMAGSSVGAHV